MRTNIDNIDIDELKRLIANLHSNYVRAMYYAEQYLISSGTPTDTQQMLKDVVLNLNVLRADANELFNLLSPLVDYKQ